MEKYSNLDLTIRGKIKELASKYEFTDLGSRIDDSSGTKNVFFDTYRTKSLRNEQERDKLMYKLEKKLDGILREWKKTGPEKEPPYMTLRYDKGRQRVSVYYDRYNPFIFLRSMGI